MDPYAYVGGNPETYTDPTGSLYEDAGGVGGGVGGGVDGLGGGLSDAGGGSGAGSSSSDGIPDTVVTTGNTTNTYDPSSGSITQTVTNADGSISTTELNPGDEGYDNAINTVDGSGSTPEAINSLTARGEPSTGVSSGNSEPSTGVSRGSEPSTAGSDPGTIPANTETTPTEPSGNVYSSTSEGEASTGNVTYSRVQGGNPPNASHFRIIVNEDGSISIPNKSANLNVSAGNDEHATYFQELRGGKGNTEIVQFELPQWFDEMVNQNAVEQKNYRSNPFNQGGTAPKIVDPTTPGRSYEFPPPWIRWIEELATNGRITK